MIIDDSIVMKYLLGQKPISYEDNWVYNNAFGRGKLFETPNPIHKDWVSKLQKKLKNQIQNFVPRNHEILKRLFPCFDDIAKQYTIIFVVGFPDPYDAMVLSHNGMEYMVFDLIQFGQDALEEEYSCHRVLTHELLHICLHKKYQAPANISYTESLDYMTFDEGFAHALTYPEDINTFQFNDFLKEKYEQASNQLKCAVAETNFEKQKSFRISANTGDYWDKFGSISGKLYILKNVHKIEEILNNGWEGFTSKIICKAAY